MNDISRATVIMKSLGSDEQAACRRVSIGICTEKLITDQAKGSLRANAKAKAAAGLRRRQSAASFSV